VDKYTWVDLGSSYLPSDILAAFLYAQLEARDRIQTSRQHVWEYYNKHLQSWSKRAGARLPFIPPTCKQSFHMFYVIMPDYESRQALIKHLRERGIQSVFHYLPLHTSEMGRQLGGKLGDCPVTEDVSDRLLRLPFYNTLAAADQQLVIDAIHSFKT
jgi:dTDP-4-amino-4,6-dideoxygalactose transaminase